MVNSIINKISANFLRNVIKVSIGLICSKALAFLLLPVLTRLYGSEQFAALGFVLSASGVLGSLYTLRLESAIVLQKSYDKVLELTSSVIFLSSFFFTVSMILISVFFSPIGNFFIERGLSAYYVFVIPVLSLAISLWFLAFAIATFEKKFGTIGKMSILQSIVDSMTSIVASCFFLIDSGLVIGKTLGQLMGSIFLIKNKLPELKPVTSTSVYRNICANKQFPLFNLPYNILIVLSRDILIWLFMYLGMVKEAGLYAFAKAIIFAPNSFIMGAITPVFHKEASLYIGTEKLEQVVSNLCSSFMHLILPALVVFGFFSEEVVSFVFGIQWQEAGTILKYYIPVIYISTLTGWSEKLYEVAHRQQYMLVLQFVGDLLCAAVILCLYILKFSALNIIFYHALLQALFLLLYYSVSLYVANLTRVLVQSITTTVFFAAFQASLIFVFLSYTTKELTSLITAALIGMMFQGFGAFNLFRNKDNVTLEN